MASVIHTLSLTLFFAFLLFGNPAFSADSPESSPSPSPHLPPEAISPPPYTHSPSPALADTPPAPPPSDLAPKSPSLAPSPGEDDGASSEHKKSPSPAPNVAADISREDQTNADDLETKDDSGGMSRGQKAGIAIGVIAAACIVGVGALVYKKRQQNIRRSEYGYAARREFL